MTSTEKVSQQIAIPGSKRCAGMIPLLDPILCRLPPELLGELAKWAPLSAQDTPANFCAISVSTVNSSLKKLEQVGYIHREKAVKGQ